MKLAAPLVATLLLGSLSAIAAPIDTSSWTTQNFATLSGHPNGAWTKTAGGAKHVSNSQPSLFLGYTPQGPVQISGEVRSTDVDDDFFGFAFGVGGGDWLLVDWKKATQTHNFTGGAASLTPSSTAKLGLAASLVSGNPTGDEFWGHVNFAQDAGGGLSELARAATLGSTGYARNTWYSFDFLVLADSVTVTVNGVEQFQIAGDFADGQFGFYNFSQPATEFRNFTATSVVPEPGTLLMAATGLGLLGGLARRRKA